MFKRIKSWYTSTVKAIAAKTNQIMTVAQVKAAKVCDVVTAAATKSVAATKTATLAGFRKLPTSVQWTLAGIAATVIVLLPVLVAVGTVALYFWSFATALFVLFDVICSTLLRDTLDVCNVPWNNTVSNGIELAIAGLAAGAALMNPVCLAAISVVIACSAMGLFAAKVRGLIPV
jgi:hypothetical protein